MLPELQEQGYSKRFTGSIIAAAGLLGIVIPPSIVMVNYGAVSGTSIGKLFLGGVVPGILAVIALSIFSMYQSKKYGYGMKDGQRQKWDIKEIFVSFVHAILPLTTPLFIIGSIAFGIATATESAVISVVWSIFLTCFVYRALSLKDLAGIIADGVGKTGQIIGMVASSAAFGYCLTVERVPAMMASFFVKYVDSVFIFFLVTFIIVFFLGMFMEVIAIIVLVAPILLPIATAMQVDLLHYGVFMCLVLMLGGLTPPVGLCLMTTSRLVDVDIDKMFPDLLWVILIYCGVFALAGFFPSLCTWLPNLLM